MPLPEARALVRRWQRGDEDARARIRALRERLQRERAGEVDAPPRRSAGTHAEPIADAAMWRVSTAVLAVALAISAGLNVSMAL